MYKKNLSGIYKHWDFLIIHMICVQLAFFLSCMIRNGFTENPYSKDIYTSVAIVSECSCMICVILFKTLKNILKRSFGGEIRAVLIQSAGVLLGDSLFLFAVKRSAEYSRIALFLMAGIYFVLALSVTFFHKRVLNENRKKAAKTRKMLIVTTSDRAYSLYSEMSSSQTLNYSLIGVSLIDGSSAQTQTDETSGIRIISRDAEELKEYIRHEWIDAIFIDLPFDTACLSEILDLTASAGITLHIDIDQINISSGESRKLVERIGEHTVMTTSINTVSAEELFLKRAMDIVGGLLGCVLTGLIALFLAPAIKLSSPGPVFFTQERVGRNGKKFRMYKFRSMYIDAEERKKALASENRVSDGMMFKLDYDPRVIGCEMRPDGTVKKGLGNFIRDTSIDEFPQFYNVLKGEMSLVGTRPPTVDEWEKYELSHRARLAIKPGITGLWQVSGRSSITDFNEVVRLDTKYISEWSLFLDIKILLKTIKVVLKREGAM